MHSGANSVEGVLLTGGASRRMGSDKAGLVVDGRPLAERIAEDLALVASRVTVLGREPLLGYAFIEDAEEYGGPLAALRRFKPQTDFVFVASCDLPLFDSALVVELLCAIGESQAAVPSLEGRLQPTCALYSKSAFDALAAAPEDMKSMMRWLESLEVNEVEEEELTSLGLDVDWARGCNTPEELNDLLARRSLPPYP